MTIKKREREVKGENERREKMREIREKIENKKKRKLKRKKRMEQTKKGVQVDKKGEKERKREEGKNRGGNEQEIEREKKGFLLLSKIYRNRVVGFRQSKKQSRSTQRGLRVSTKI